MMDLDKASLLVHTFWDICDPQHTNLDANNAYELCLLFLISNFIHHELAGTPETRFEFLNDAATVIKNFKEGGMFSHYLFSVIAGIIGEWCEHN
jgi:hypothetical protein